jgi:hypothetical protein
VNRTASDQLLMVYKRCSNSFLLSQYIAKSCCAKNSWSNESCQVRCILSSQLLLWHSTNHSVGCKQCSSNGPTMATKSARVRSHIHRPASFYSLTCVMDIPMLSVLLPMVRHPAVVVTVQTETVNREVLNTSADSSWGPRSRSPIIPA